MNEERLARAEAQIENIQNDVNDLKQITKIIYNMSFNIESMCKEMKNMNERITKIENEPIDNYKSFKKKIIEYIATAILGIIIGYLATKF